MNDFIKEWLSVLIDEEIDSERRTIANERVWADGSIDEETASSHEENITNHEEYIKVLEEIKSRYVGD